MVRVILCVATKTPSDNLHYGVLGLLGYENVSLAHRIFIEYTFVHYICFLSAVCDICTEGLVSLARPNPREGSGKTL